MTKYPLKRVQDALRRAEQNVQEAIEILRIVSENGGLTAGERQKLKEILNKC
jgi:ribosomal protein L7Ae-like RNA K-turn-binding protein